MNAPHVPIMPFGAERLDDGLVRFRLWAPDAQRVVLQLADGRRLAMADLYGGVYEVDAPARPGARYRFEVDGQPVPDPASRQQDGGVTGWSVLTDPNAYTWQSADWLGRPWHETVIYELHAGVCGGFAGVRERIPALAQLGITAIELMPIAAFAGERGWGYDGVLQFAPHASYGTPDELKALIDTAHRHGVQVFLDVVYNHFGPAGNAIPGYAAGFFHTDTTGWGTTINTRAPEVTAFFVANACYWLNEFRFDGLRLDAVHAIGDDDWLRTFAQQVRKGVDARRHVHLIMENAENKASLLQGDAFVAQWNDDAHHVLHHLLTGEADGYYAAYAEEPAVLLARMLSEGFIYQGQPFEPWQGRSRGEPSAQLPPLAFINFLQNHDQVGNRALGERLTTLADPQALSAALALLLLTPPVPLLFMGEEWGETAPFLYFIDHEPELAAAVREGRRREFADFARFSDPKAREAIPDPQDVATFERSRPGGAHGAAERERLSLVGLLLTLRRDYLVPALPGARPLGAAPVGGQGVLARWQLRDGRVLVVLANFGPAQPESALPAPLPEQALLFQTPLDATADLAAGRIPAHSCLVWLDQGETLR
ncbi:malto-oligosyltrehalose trehalohydrolase [Chitiniphilus purpureus]|uniref:Malto-oligosyltrehalose trehalohydrolase n=1 Tax=Chitiniphilus purpureus TaxID=2981137 RepID=A0ABY6DLU8_9NEIS|nr:malto-oligosyltrehalose trehalohydrolase [Chitiniphilus sp. CD1]UXY15350.1 malto-oligosyltrehalose trehalohydrolase [Chitiniphilus sp. CD1]